MLPSRRRKLWSWCCPDRRSPEGEAEERVRRSGFAVSEQMVLRLRGRVDQDLVRYRKAFFECIHLVLEGCALRHSDVAFDTSCGSVLSPVGI